MASSDNIQIKLTNVRLSFPALFSPEIGQRDDGTKTKSWKATFLLDKKKHADLIAEIEDAIEDAIDAKWPTKPPKIKADKRPLRDGDDEDYDGYEGCMYVSARSYQRIPVVDRDRTPLDEEDGKPYAGCYVNAVIRIYAQDNDYGKRINASLEAVQFVKDGDAFGRSAIDPDDVFEVIDDDEDDAPRGRRSRRNRDEDDDEPPKSRRSRRNRDEDEDDEDEAPRSRRSRRNRDEDEDEDEAPRSRRSRRSRDEDEDDEDEAPRGKRRKSRDDIM